MDNRNRDKMNQKPSSTPAGDVNRNTSDRQGQQQKNDSSADFGQNIGRSENVGNEPNRRTGSDLGNSGSSQSSSSSDWNKKENDH